MAKKMPRKNAPPSQMNVITLALTPELKEALNHWSKVSMVPKRRLLMRALVESMQRQGYTFPSDDDQGETGL